MSDGAIKYKSVSASTTICKGLCKYYGYIVTTAVATAPLQIRDAVAAATGTVVDAVATSSPIGTNRVSAFPIQLETGLQFDLNGGTGTVVVLYEGQS